MGKAKLITRMRVIVVVLSMMVTRKLLGLQSIGEAGKIRTRPHHVSGRRRRGGKGFKVDEPDGERKEERKKKTKTTDVNMWPGQVMCYGNNWGKRLAVR